ncbi:hypothetical protein V2G26_017725 [Clonostachys chloroleuca]|uniref:HAUS augmin-like complex subunit 1 n=1 Tax=Clonostachys chloroleuca TaxID=1926264 RepID=A0AA35Q456_9HYPO|nr:unnamed protein product [Clonostachys chloroleuca]
MAHLHQRHLHHRHLSTDSAAIFSPTVARQAASAARDWSYVDAWLSSKFHNRPVPEFERNPDTLRALLALASLNETADEERASVARADADALRELRKHDESTARNPSIREEFLAAIEDDLPRESKVALDGMAAMAVEAGIAHAEPEDLGARIIALQKSVHDAEQMRARVEVLGRHIAHDAQRMSEFLAALQGDDYKLPEDQAKQNLDLQRKVKALSAQIPELQERAASLASSVSSSHPTIDDVVREEKEYLAILSRKKQLDSQMASFEGLPSNTDMARSELDALRKQLRGVTSRRDAVFEGLVERESPVKRR